MEITNQTPQQEQPAQEPSETPEALPTSPIKVTPMLKTLLIILAVLFGFVILTLLLFPQAPPQPTVQVPSPVPSAGSSNAPVTRPVSEFGQRPEFVAFEEKLRATREQQNSLDLDESQITFPLLEMNVNFEN